MSSLLHITSVTEGGTGDSDSDSLKNIGNPFIFGMGVCLG
jgi:hypothetical protein